MLTKWDTCCWITIHHDQIQLTTRITAFGRLVYTAEGGAAGMMAEYCLEMQFDEPWDYDPFETYEPVAGFGGQRAYCAITHLSPSLIPTLPTDMDLLGYKDGTLVPVPLTVEKEVLLLIPIEEMLGLERLRMLYRAPPFVPEFPGSRVSFVCRRDPFR